jgi:hypothetical protein
MRRPDSMYIVDDEEFSKNAKIMPVLQMVKQNTGIGEVKVVT